MDGAGTGDDVRDDGGGRWWREGRKGAAVHAGRSARSSGETLAHPRQKGGGTRRRRAVKKQSNKVKLAGGRR